MPISLSNEGGINSFVPVPQKSAVSAGKVPQIIQKRYNCSQGSSALVRTPGNSMVA